MCRPRPVPPAAALAKPYPGICGAAGQCLKASPGNLQGLDVWAKLERNEGDVEAEARLLCQR